MIRLALVGGLVAGVVAALALLAVGLLQAELRHIALPMLGAIAFIGLCAFAWMTR